MKFDLTLYQMIAFAQGNLRFSHTIHTFNDLEKEDFENIIGKGENAGNQHFLLFSTMFPTLLKKNFIFSVTFIFLSANAFDLDLSKNFLFGKE